MSLTMLIEPNPAESLEPMSFRGSSDDRAIVAELMQRFGCTASAAVRISLRITRDLTMLPRLMECGHRVHVNGVLREGKSV